MTPPLLPSANPAIWRGGDCAPEPTALPGLPDAGLPGGGWPTGALTEIVLEREGIGEIRLALPALARLQAQGRDVVWIAPPHVPYAPALATAGLDLARLLVVHCKNSPDQLWAYEQALRAPECGAAFAWLGAHDDRVMRRLAVAAREGRTWGVLWRRPGQHAIASAASLRLALAPQGSWFALLQRSGVIAKPPRRRRSWQPVRPRVRQVRPPVPKPRIDTMPRSPLARHFFTMACNNAWANHRLLTACCQLSQADFVAPRTSFFPSLKATLNHNLTVDWYYVDALERFVRGQPVNSEPGRFFEPEEPFAVCRELHAAQRDVDRRLVDACATLTEAQLEMPVPVQRRAGIQTENATRLLAHLFQHQIHHRGQAHAMLAGTSRQAAAARRILLRERSPPAHNGTRGLWLRRRRSGAGRQGRSGLTVARG